MVETSRPSRAPAGTTVVALPAEIDMGNACRVGEELCSAFGPGVSVVIADMSGTRFCDSLGSRTLVMAHKQGAASSAEFQVVISTPAILRVLGILRLDTVLAVCPSLEAALAAGDHVAE